MKHIDLTQWYASAMAGESVVYRHEGGRFLNKTQAVQQARDLYDMGLVDLVQRRNGRGLDYLAIKRRHVAKIDPRFTFAACLGHAA